MPSRALRAGPCVLQPTRSPSHPAARLAHLFGQAVAAFQPAAWVSRQQGFQVPSWYDSCCFSTRNVPLRLDSRCTRLAADFSLPRRTNPGLVLRRPDRSLGGRHRGNSGCAARLHHMPQLQGIRHPDSAWCPWRGRLHSMPRAAGSFRASGLRLPRGVRYGPAPISPGKRAGRRNS